MRPFTSALHAEGETDHLFLRPLLGRVVNSLCGAHPSRSVAVSPVAVLRSLGDDLSGLDVLFLHTDGGGNWKRQYGNVIEPQAARVTAAANVRPVGVVPVKEMEAWVLADGDAIRRAFDTRLSDVRLGLPSRPRGVESIADPKATLKTLMTTVLGKRHRLSVDYYLPVLGEEVGLDALRLVPAFQRFEAELKVRLTALGFLRRPR